MALTLDKTKTAFDSQFPVDKIIGTYSGTFSALAGASGAACGTFGFVADISGYSPTFFFTQMIWSDDGTNWFPGGNPHNTLSSYNNNGQELTVISIAIDTAVYVYGLNQRTNDVSIQYKVAVFDRSY